MGNRERERERDRQWRVREGEGESERERESEKERERGSGESYKVTCVHVLKVIHLSTKKMLVHPCSHLHQQQHRPHKLSSFISFFFSSLSLHFVLSYFFSLFPSHVCLTVFISSYLLLSLSCDWPKSTPLFLTCSLRYTLNIYLSPPPH